MGLPEQWALTLEAVPGPRRLGSGGGRPAPFVRVFFRRGACRRFLCPSFRFPLARPRHSWREREWGRGFPERDVLGHCGRTPPSQRYTSPRPGRRAAWPESADPLGRREEKRAWDPRPAGMAALPSAPSGLAVGGSGRRVPGALLSARLLCLGSFICQLLRLGRGQQGLRGPMGASPLPLSLAAQSCCSTPTHPPSRVEGLNTVKQVVL